MIIYPRQITIFIKCKRRALHDFDKNSWRSKDWPLAALSVAGQTTAQWSRALIIQTAGSDISRVAPLSSNVLTLSINLFASTDRLQSVRRYSLCLAYAKVGLAHPLALSYMPEIFIQIIYCCRTQLIRVWEMSTSMWCKDRYSLYTRSRKRRAHCTWHIN